MNISPHVNTVAQEAQCPFCHETFNVVRFVTQPVEVGHSIILVCDACWDGRVAMTSLQEYLAK